MQVTDRQTEGGEPAAAAAVSYFRCAYCGASTESNTVSYDRLGYPRCPVCGTEHGP